MTRALFLLLFFLCAATLAPLSSPRAAELPPPQFARITLHAEVAAVTPGQPFWVAVEQQIAPGWHTYWVNAGDSGTPTNVKWNLPEGATAESLVFPTPHRIAMPPLVNFGYEDRAVYLARITAPAQIEGGQFTVKADIDWLVCKDICIPEGASYELTLPVTDSAAAGTPPAIFAQAREAIAAPSGAAFSYREERGSFIATIKPDDALRAAIPPDAQLALFPYEWGLFAYADLPTVARENDGDITLTLTRDTRPLAEVENARFILSATGADGRTVSFDLSGSLNKDAGAAAAPTAGQPETTEKSDMGFLPAILFAVLGGMILNLMPCVFPVLSLKALSLAKLSAAERSHARLHGLSYAAGIIVSFLALAGVLTGLKAAGAQIGWGFQLQNAYVTLALVLLITLIAFALLDWIRLPARLSGLGSKLAQGGGLAASFWTGVLAAVVASPCTAPFMGAAVGYALVQPGLAGLAVFAALGFGLSLPYLLLTCVPGASALLPKPGAWMETFRQFLAFPMFATALWLVWVFDQQTDSFGAVLAVSAVLYAGLAAWAALIQPRTTAGQILRAAAIVIAIAGIAAAFVLTTPSGSVMKGTVIPYTPAALEKALEGPDPVFVNMTAAWCITCKVNEKVAIDTPATHALFSERNVQYLQGDWTSRNADITQFLAQYGRGGVPLYVVYGAAGKAGTRDAPRILPQLLSEGILREAITGQQP